MMKNDKYNVSHGEKKELSETKILMKRLLILMVALGSFWLFSKYVMSLNFISGNSMNPYIYDNGIVLTNTGNFELNRYSVYIIDMPDGNGYKSANAIKRLVGMPNDTLQFIDGTILINGERIIDEYDYYTIDGGSYNDEIINLSEDEYFFVGDNRNHSYDSREYGVITENEIFGEVIKVLYKGNKE